MEALNAAYAKPSLEWYKSVSAARLRGLTEHFDEKRFYETLPLKAFIRVIREKTIKELTDTTPPTDLAAAEERLQLRPGLVPSWAYDAGSAAFAETKRLWSARGFLSSHALLSESAQVHNLASSSAAIFLAAWHSRMETDAYNEAVDKGLYLRVRLEEIISNIKKEFLGRRADLLVFREPFVVYARAGAREG